MIVCERILKKTSVIFKFLTQNNNELCVWSKRNLRFKLKLYKNLNSITQEKFKKLFKTIVLKADYSMESRL